MAPGKDMLELEAMPRTSGGTGSRRERRAAETRERIFTAAIELFAARGLDAVTVEQITERAEVGKGTFFNYFSSKEAVLTYFGGEQVNRLRQAFARGEVRGNAREKLRQVLHILSTHPSLTPDLARGLFAAHLMLGKVLETEGPSIWEMRDLLTRIIEEGQETGLFNPAHEAEKAALFVIGQYFLSMLTWCAGFTDQSLPDLTNDYILYALDGLSAPPDA